MQSPQTLLKAVSRSFSLSISLLPAGLRRPVGLAYLLARATDTIADTAELPADQRLAHLALLAAAIQDGRPGAELAGLAERFSSFQQNADERQLILDLPLLLPALAHETEADQASIRSVLRHITRGQTLDVQRFGAPGVHALATAAELEEYTYLVAGSVGEFWTDLCERHVPGFATRPLDEMHRLGREYGCGLQLVNILRDVPGDLAQGRCYLPLDELAAAGVTLADVASDPRRLAPAWRHWLPRARAGLQAGLRYTDAVQGRRLRAAAALPALLGVRTLGLMETAGDAALLHPVKMPRSEVRTLLWQLLFGLASRSSIARAHARWDNPGR